VGESPTRRFAPAGSNRSSHGVTKWLIAYNDDSDDYHQVHALILEALAETLPKVLPVPLSMPNAKPNPWRSSSVVSRVGDMENLRSICIQASAGQLIV
jgi:hypothetical protein